MADGEVWVVERFDHNSDEVQALAYTADGEIAAGYAGRLTPLLSDRSGVRCYQVPLLAAIPEPFTGHSMNYTVDATGAVDRPGNSTHLVLSQDAPEAAHYPPDPLIAVWRPGEDGSRAGKDAWHVVGTGRDSRALEHRCRLEVLAILTGGRTEEGHWHGVAEHACPECGRAAGWDCDFGEPGTVSVGFHRGRVDAMKREAARRAAVWRERDMPLWREVKDPEDRWWER
jgi:hypothetical protein